MPGEIYERAAKSPPGYHSVAGEIVACDSSKIHVDGLTYEGAEEVFDYQTKEKVRGYKLFVIYVIELRSVLIKLFKSLMVHIYFSFIAYDIVNIFKRALAEEYRNAGIEVLRRDCESIFDYFMESYATEIVIRA